MRTWLLVFSLLLGLHGGTAVQAASPVQYWIVAPASTASPIVTPRVKTPYTYGWFGATTPYRNANHHRGYQGTYIDWTFR